MAWWNRKKEKPEQRATAEDPRVPISSENIIDFLNASGGLSASGVSVDVEKAMGVPAIWAAVNFIAGTIAGLPLHVYRKTDEGRQRVTGGLANILHDAVNDEMSSFEWRKYSFERTLTTGRSLTFIERNAMGRIVNLWPLNPENVTIEVRRGRKFYKYRDNGDRGREVTYEAREIIDIPFSLKSDMVTARSPILTNKDVIGLGIAATNYGSKLFQNGGVPPFIITGNFQSGKAMQRASDDLQEAIKRTSKENRQALALPLQHEIKTLGIDPDKSQLVELKKFLIEEYARIYSLPPVFLQDLSHGTFSNTEQQDLHFVKHTIKRWIEQAEQEMNLKLFGKNNSTQYVEFNLDGLLRGDFKTRMEGYAQAIQNAIYTPAQVQEKENLPRREEADVLLVQGGTVPLKSQPTTPEPDNDEA